MAFRQPIADIQLQMYEQDTLAIQESLELLLPRFGKIQDWADVEKWLKRLKKLFSVKKSPFIAHKQELFQRLAQCLNPSLPIGVHSLVLECYDLILTNFKQEPENTINDLHLICLGLFPYSQICSNQIKGDIVALIENHFLPLGTQLGPLLTQLISSLLPTLIDNNQEIRKQIFELFQKLKEIFPQKLISQCLWIIILRQKSCRYGAILYLHHILHKQMDISNFTDSEEITEQIQKKSEKLQLFTKKSIIQVEVDEEKNSHNIEDSVSETEQSVKSVKVVPLLENKASIEQNQEIEDKFEEKLIETINVNQQKQMSFRASFSATDILNQNKDPYDRFQKYSKVMYQKWSEEITDQNIYFPDINLITEALIKAIKEPNVLVQKKSLDFLINYCFLKSEKFTEEQYINLFREILPLILNQDFNIKRRIKIYCIGSESNEHEIDELHLSYLLRVLKYWSQKDSHLFLEITLTLMMENGSLIKRLIGSISMQIVQSLNQVDFKQKEKFFSSIGIHFYNLLQNSTQYDEISDFQVFIDFFMFEKDQIFYEFLMIKIVTKINKMIRDQQKGLQSILVQFQIFLSSTHQSLENDKFIEGMPFKQFLENIQILNQNSEFFENYLDCFEKCLLLSSWILIKLRDDDLTAQWVNSTRQILVYLIQEPEYVLAIIKGIYHLFNLSDTSPKSLEKLQDLAMIKSWQLIEYQEYQNEALTLINLLFKKNPQNMKYIIVQQLKQQDSQVSIKFMQNLLTYIETSDQDNYCEMELKELIIFQILDFLENEHPIKRQMIKSWLMEQKNNFGNLIDLLIKILLKNSHFFTLADKKMVHYEEYDTQAILGVFRKMKYLLNTNQNIFVDFVNNQHLSEGIVLQMFQVMTSDEMNKYNKYYQLIIILVLRFLSAQTIPFQSQTFKDQNLLVQTAACETLQVLCNNLSSSNNNIIGKKLLEKVVGCYKQFVQHEQPIMQVHLLDVIKELIDFLDDFEIYHYYFIKKNLLEELLVSVEQSKDNFTVSKILDFLDQIIALFEEKSNQESNLMLTKVLDFQINEILKNKQTKGLILKNFLKKIKKYCLKNEQTKSSLWFWKTSKASTKSQIKEYIMQNFTLMVAIFQQNINNKNKTNIFNNMGLLVREKQVSSSLFYTVRMILGKNKIQFLNEIMNIISDSFTYDKDQLEYNVILSQSVALIQSLMDVYEFHQLIVKTDFFKETQKNNSEISNFQNKTKQQSILCVYYYLMSFQEEEVEENLEARINQLRKQWLDIIDFLQKFSKSLNIMTLCWILDLIYLFSSIFNPHRILNEYKIYKNLHNLECDVILQLLDRCYSDWEISQEKNYCLQGPLSPTLILLFNQNPVYESKIVKKFKKPRFPIYFLKILSMTLLQKVTKKIFIQTYQVDKQHHINKRYLPLVEKVNDYLMQESIQNQFEKGIRSESVKFLAEILGENIKIYSKNIKFQVKKFFDSSSFFNAEIKDLESYRIIIKTFINSSKEQGIQSYLQKINFSSYFKSEKQEKKVRFESLMRGELISKKGDFLNRKTLKYLLEKIRDVIKVHAEDTSLLIALFFALRIMILKTQEKLFNEVFPLIWPTLYILMINIFKSDNYKSLELKLATLKLLEILVHIKYETFFLNYWIFGIDSSHFEIKKQTKLKLPSFTAQFAFMPFLMSLIKKNVYLNYYKFSKPQETQVKLIFTKNQIESETELSSLVEQFLNQFSLISRQNCQIKKQQISDIIFYDFVDLNRILNKE